MQIDYQSIRKKWNQKGVKTPDDIEEFEFCDIHEISFPASLDCPKCKCSL